ncbi:MAG: glycosyltransferase family 2 protein [Candidatus Dormibacteraceae bacterium]
MSPDVTVVIPVWDMDKTILEQSIASVLAQSEPVRLLIVDNQSSEPVAIPEGAEILHLSSRVSVAEVRMAGLATVETPYAMFMDADDILLPQTVHHLRSLLRRTPDASVVAGRIIEWNPDTGATRAGWWPTRTAQILNRWPAIFRTCNAIRNMTPIVGCALFRTALAQTSAGVSPQTAEDWTFGASLAFRGRVVLSNVPCKLYRWRPGSLSQRARSDWHALYAARRATRECLRLDPAVPNWVKSLLPLFSLAHMLEIPLHIRRERWSAQRKAS